MSEHFVRFAGPDCDGEVSVMALANDCPRSRDTATRTAPPARKNRPHRMPANRHRWEGAGSRPVKAGRGGICGSRMAGRPVVAALWPGSADRYSVQ